MVYAKLLKQFANVKGTIKRPLTLAEKILYTHTIQPTEVTRGQSNLKLIVDRVAMQDASAQTAILQFMTAGLDRSLVPASIHCDHLIVAHSGSKADLVASHQTSREIFEFLESAAKKYGIEFWKPGSGIIHQVVLENYATPGYMMLGTDSHTPMAGGLGMIAIGVGGADAVDAMTLTPWELKAPKIMGVKLSGKLNGWASPKDLILKLAGHLTTRGGTGHIIEYFGDGVNTLSCTGMATICNMGAEVGATTSLFPYTPSMGAYLSQTNRKHVADSAKSALDYLTPDRDAEYDKVIEIDLSTLEPYLNGPFTPDLATPISAFKSEISKNDWPEQISVGLIGSCTNSSYEDMSRVVSIVDQANKAGIKPKTPFLVTPGSEQIRATIQRDGLTSKLEGAGATVLANACGPCIGQWKRTDVDASSSQPIEKNAILTSFNRNFRARNDGRAETLNFLTSPEIVTAMIYSGEMGFNPMIDSIKLKDGSEFKFNPPEGTALPSDGFDGGNPEYRPEANPPPDAKAEIVVSPESERIQLIYPWDAFHGDEFKDLTVLVKVKGKCTTDHISAAGAWLKYKGHLQNISKNTLIGALNADNNEVNLIHRDGSEYSIPEMAEVYKSQGKKWIVVAEHNYGEGSAREHAAMQPRYLGGVIVLVKSFARIHETNLKKQGILPLSFVNEKDYDLIKGGDSLSTVNLMDMINGDRSKPITNGRVLLKFKGENGEYEIEAAHTMSWDQVDWFIAGGALNLIRAKLA